MGKRCQNDGCARKAEAIVCCSGCRRNHTAECNLRHAIALHRSEKSKSPGSSPSSGNTQGNTPRNASNANSPRARNRPPTNSPRHASNASSPDSPRARNLPQLGNKNRTQAGKKNSPLSRPSPKGRVIPGSVRRAVLVGCNYTGGRNALDGSIKDTDYMYRLLTSTYGWSDSSIRVLTDNTKHRLPTRRNILEACVWLVDDAQAGDTFVFFFSGHGAQAIDMHGYEEDGMNETILPIDHATTGVIYDDVLNKALVQPLPEGARLIAVIDACHSGTGLDLPFTWRNKFWVEETNPFHTVGDVQLIGATTDSEDDISRLQRAHSGGMLTTALCYVLSRKPSLPWSVFLQSLANNLNHQPIISSSQQFDFSNIFNLDNSAPVYINPNTNAILGRIFRHKFSHQPSTKAKVLKKNMLAMTDALFRINKE